MQCPRCNAGTISEVDNQCSECGFSLVDGKKPGIEVSSDVERSIRRAFRPEFRIERLLGRGGMSLVYLAHEVELNRSVALKVLPLQLALGTDAAERFKREARIAASLDHPHIVPIHQIGSRSTFLWFTMKFVKGRSLVELIDHRGPLGLVECLSFVEQVAGALHYAHDRGVVHRDVKPANVMIDENGWALVCDFGVAKAFGAVPLTQTGGTMGTPSHMSPEQLYGQQLTGRTDQYSLAIMTYECLAGSPPFVGDSLGEVLRQHCLEPPPHLSAVRPEIPTHVSDALVKAMSKKPGERFDDVLDFVSALGGRRPGSAGARAYRSEVLETTAPMRTWRFGRRSRMRTEQLPVLAAFGGLLFAVSVALASLVEPLPRGSMRESLSMDPMALEVDRNRNEEPTALRDSTQSAGATDSSAGPLAVASDTAVADSAAGEAESPQAAPVPVETLSKTVRPSTTRADPRPAADRPRRVPQKTPTQTADPEPSTPREPPPAPDPRVEIEQVVAFLSDAISSRDVGRFRAVHPNLTEDEQLLWERFFGSLESLEVAYQIAGFEVTGDSATVALNGSYQYQRADGSPGQHTEELRVALVKGAAGWAVTSIKNR